MDAITHAMNVGYRLMVTAALGRPHSPRSPPLTDPSADAFMERLKKLGREPVNSPDKVTV